MIQTPGAAVEAGVAPLPEVKEKDPVQEIVNNVAQLESGVCDQAVEWNKAAGGWEEEVVDKNSVNGIVRRYRRFPVNAGGQCVVVVSEGDPNEPISRLIAVVGFTNARVASNAIANRSRLEWKGMDSRSSEA